jgi:hypothetical protein
MYGMSLNFARTILAVVLTASSPYAHGTRYELEPCNRDWPSARTRHRMHFLQTSDLHGMRTSLALPIGRRQLREGDPDCQNFGSACNACPARLSSARTYLKSSDIMRPKCKARAGQTESTSNGFCHGLECAFAITTPMNREPLTSGGRRTGKERSGIGTKLLLDRLEYYFVVQVGVVAVISNLRVERSNNRRTCAFCWCISKGRSILS